MKYLLKSVAALLVLSTLGACSSFAPAGDEYVRIKKEDLEAAERFLVAQAYYQPMLEEQQQQLTESLALLQDYLDEAQGRQETVESVPSTESDAQQQSPRPDKQIVGEVENILLTNENIMLEARIDTGATTSSLDAKDIQSFERNGEDWVRFTIVNPETGEDVTLERERVRRVRVVQANNEDPERRPVVNIHITVGRVSQVAEFTLSDRSHLEFSALIGRNVLRDVMMVDVSARNFAPPVRPNTPESGDEQTGS